MPFDHIGNTSNGNQLSGGGIASSGATLRGRTSNLPIFEVRYSDLVGHPRLQASSLSQIINKISKDPRRDSSARRTDHRDDLGNLPVIPGGRVTYREYHVESTTFTKPGYIRVVADLAHKRLFLTVTHYDVYLVDPVAAGNANVGTAIAPTTNGAHSPFFLVTGVGAYNSWFY